MFLTNHSSAFLLHDVRVVKNVACFKLPNVSLPRRPDPKMELITYSFVLYLQHGRHDVKCKPSIACISLYLLNIQHTDA